MAEDKICEICKSDKGVEKYGKTGQYLCKRHYLQLCRYGKILKRTIRDKNEIIEYNDYAEIILYNKDCEEIARAIIDLEMWKNAKTINGVYTPRIMLGLPLTKSVLIFIDF